MPTFNIPSTPNPFGINVIGKAFPTFVDIDGDGDLDALIGGREGTYYYENIGTASVPAFAPMVLNPFGLTIFNLDSNVAISAPVPTFGDIDGDGDLDALVGVTFDNLIYYENIGTASVPAFATGVANPFGLTKVEGTSATTPTLVDIDGDGDLDVFVGEYLGNIYYYENIGTAIAPAFAAPVTNPFGLTKTDSYYVIPSFVDIDGDGDLDAFVGGAQSTGNIYYYENIGTASVPAFAAPVTNPFNLAPAGNIFRAPTFVDIDGDGDVDAFIGGNNGAVYYSENAPIVSIAGGTTPPAEGGATGIFTLTLSETAPDGGISVAYTVTGTATNGTDYTALSGTVTIPAGQTTATIDVVPIDDAIVDPDETVTVTLTDGAAYNLAPGPNDTATLTITDNDSAGVTITPTATSATEGGATGSYTVVLISQPTDDVSIAIANGSQTSTSANTLIFTAANWDVAQTVTVTATDDTAVEGNHTGTISHTVTSTDTNYNRLATAGVTVAITDNDLANNPPEEPTAETPNPAPVIENVISSPNPTPSQPPSVNIPVVSVPTLIPVPPVVPLGLDIFAMNLESFNPIAAALPDLSSIYDIETSIPAPNVTEITVDGSETDDILIGGDRAETFNGLGGNDFLQGLSGNDNLFGGDGNDLIHGNQGDDYIDGGDGNDILYGGQGDDTLKGGNDNDVLFGDLGNDIIWAGSGNDFVYGNQGDDTLSGGDGDDVLWGGKDNDLLIGGNGNDWLLGDLGDDTLMGGAGSDRFVIRQNAGVDLILDFTDGEDLIGLAPELTFENLTLTQGNIGTLIYAGNDLLAILNGVDVSAINQQDFFAVG